MTKEVVICPWCETDMAHPDTTTCTVRSLTLQGREYAPIPYRSCDALSGDERCHDCGIAVGGIHHPGCDYERCPACGGQLVACGCQEEELRELYRVRLGQFEGRVLESDTDGTQMGLYVNGILVAMADAQNAGELSEVADSCSDLMQAIARGMTCEEWRAESRAGARLFQPGRVVITNGAAQSLVAAMMSPESLLDRHLSGDWGDICAEDREENERGLQENLRLMSVYTLAKTGVTLWVITEWDRSASTILLPDEY